MADVYNGKIWADVQYVKGQPFLAETNNFALMMNVDWCQPFKHSPYSVGVIYLVQLRKDWKHSMMPDGWNIFT